MLSEFDEDSTAVTIDTGLDQDLKDAFNQVAGKNLQAQQIILQLQTNRHLNNFLQESQQKGEE